MDDTFWDSFAIEFSEFIDEVGILDEEGSDLSGGHGVLVVVDGYSLGVGELGHGF